MGLSGNLQTMSLPTLVQFVVQEGGQAHIHLEKDTEHSGSLYFDSEGRLCHAISNHNQRLPSEEVVYELLSWHSGTFSVTKDVAPPAHTINKTWNFLLMEGLRKLDERQAQEEISQIPEETLSDMLTGLSASDAAAIEMLVAAQKKEIKDTMATKSEQLQSILSNLVNSSGDISGAAVVDNEGLLLASALSGSIDSNRVAAVTAGLISLAGRSAQQLGQGEVNQTLIQAQNGNVVAIRAGSKGSFVALTPTGGNLGMMFMECREAADAVREVLG